jgi:hypothetical protein
MSGPWTSLLTDLLIMLAPPGFFKSRLVLVNTHAPLLLQGLGRLGPTKHARVAFTSAKTLAQLLFQRLCTEVLRAVAVQVFN